MKKLFYFLFRISDNKHNTTHTHASMSVCSNSDYETIKKGSSKFPINAAKDT